MRHDPWKVYISIDSNPLLVPETIDSRTGRSPDSCNTRRYATNALHRRVAGGQAMIDYTLCVPRACLFIGMITINREPPAP